MIFLIVTKQVRVLFIFNEFIVQFLFLPKAKIEYKIIFKAWKLEKMNILFTELAQWYLELSCGFKRFSKEFSIIHCMIKANVSIITMNRSSSPREREWDCRECGVSFFWHNRRLFLCVSYPTVSNHRWFLLQVSRYRKKKKRKNLQSELYVKQLLACEGDQWKYQILTKLSVKGVITFILQNVKQQINLFLIICNLVLQA